MSQGAPGVGPDPEDDMQAHLAGEADERPDVVGPREVERPRAGLDRVPEHGGLDGVQAREAGGVEAVAPEFARDPCVLDRTSHDPDTPPVDLEAPAVKGDGCHALRRSSGPRVVCSPAGRGREGAPAKEKEETIEHQVRIRKL